MTKKIDSQALGTLNKALGLTGAGSPITELADGVVDQVVSVNEIARRSRTLNQQFGGLFRAVLRNNHSGAGTLTTTVNPFALPVALVFSPFPTPIPDSFDLWLLTVDVSVVGAGTLTAALFINHPAANTAFSSTNTGVQVGAAVTGQPVCFFDTVIDENVLFGIQESGEPTAYPGLRLPRDRLTQLVFASTASAAQTFDMRLGLGLFPVGLGQDGLV